MRVAFFWSTTVASLVTMAASQAETCPMTCQQDATCQLGDADWSAQPKDSNDFSFEFLKTTNKDGWYCDCPENWTGLRCARPYVKCQDTDHYCYHGGTCIDEQTGKLKDSELFCDCSNAEHNDIAYVGKYCEVEGAQQCATGSTVFCTNGGTCKDDFESKAHPCDCLDGHRGPHCEFDRGHIPECDLKCEQDGSCMLGIKDYDTAIYSDFWALHDGNFTYCDCPEGYFGLECETQGVACGDAHCFNGAACLETLGSDGQTTFACDCLTAGTDQDSFAGQYCQSESTSYCTKNANHNGHLFCTNGGTCREDTHEGCECPTGYHGTICEFKDNGSGVPQESICKLDCSNGGRCRKGKKDNKLIARFGNDLKQFNETHLLWEHCVCPDGFFGIQCEHQLEICPGGDHVCLHGSKCVAESESSENLQHKCDCDHGFDAVEKYAGKFCQYTSTDICTKNGQPGVGKANFAFCVNNGKCKKKVGDTQQHPGCNCEEGFTGEHCEFLKGQQPTAPTPSVPGPSSQSASGEDTTSIPDDYNPNEGLIIGLAVALLVLVVFIGTALVRTFMGRNTAGKADVDSAPLPEPEPEPMRYPSEPSGPNPFMAEETMIQNGPPSPEKDLQTVEII